jgi:hypothetical protein
MTDHLSSELPEFAAHLRGFIRNFSARWQEGSPGNEPSEISLIRPPGTFSPIGGEGGEVRVATPIKSSECITTPLARPASTAFVLACALIACG